MFENAAGVSSILVIAIVICFFAVLLSIRRAKKYRMNVDFDKRIILYDEQLSDAQKQIKKEYGEPLEIRYQESIDNTISIWVYPEIIVSFNQDGTLRKIMK
ncbi:MAG TPA: hypothetical protein PLM75_00175 [bacterium]|nr:hypothetical protein [bacterium]